MQLKHLIARIRWNPTEPVAESLERRVLVRVFAYLFGIGGALALATLALPAAGRFAPGVAAAAVAALAVSAVLVIGFDKLPLAFLYALPFLGTLLASVAVLSGGSEGFSAYALFYFWVVFAAFSFFSLGWGIANVAFLSAIYALVLALHSGHGAAPLRWVMTVVTVTVAGLLISLLRDRMDGLIARHKRHGAQQAAVAELSERALEGADLWELMVGVADTLVDTLEVEISAVLQLLPGSREFLLCAARGANEGLVHSLTVPNTPESHAGYTLAADAPVVVSDWDTEDRLPGVQARRDHDVLSGLFVVVRGTDGPWGVLGAHSTDQRAYTRNELDFAQSLANILTEAIGRRETEGAIRHSALHDELTDLPNRTLFVDRLDRALMRASRGRSTVAVLYLDVDGFKRVNDASGHGVGDLVLKAIGPRIRTALYMTDTVARFGGDEYALICEDIAGDADALEIGDRVRDVLSEAFVIEGMPHAVTASVGIALSTGPSEGAEAMIRDADIAMYRSKERGRNRCELFDDTLRKRILSRIHIENALRGALERDELSLRYQPIVSLRDRELQGVEALLRWEHSGLGPVSPAEFIPVAEQGGLILPIGEWVIHEACRQAAEWRKSYGADAPLPINVNLSPRQLSEPGLAATVAGAIAEAGLEPRDLALEITESALVEDAELAAAKLRELKVLGIKVLLDDFGTGYSSLSYLKRFPIDTLKIDRSFVTHLSAGTGDATIVSAVVGMAEAFGMDVVLEGIETEEQAVLGSELGCGLAQGYHFARPMPAEAIPAFLVAKQSGAVLAD